MPDKPYQDIPILWQNIAITVCFCPCYSKVYFSNYGHSMTHIELQRDEPGELPMSTTGYCSHFVNQLAVDAPGSVLDYVMACLDHESKWKSWQDYVANSQQLTLF